MMKRFGIDDDDDGEEVQHFLYIHTPDRPPQRLLCYYIILYYILREFGLPILTSSLCEVCA